MNLLQLIGSFVELSPVVQLGLIGLGAVAVQQFRQGHIGRIGVVASAVIVLQYAYPIWNTLSPALRWYSMGAAAFGLLGGTAYLTRTSLPTIYSKAAFVLYGAIPVILVVVFGFSA